MPAAAEPAERIDGEIGLTRIDCDALDFAIVEKRTQIAQALGPFSAEQDHRRFNEADHRYQPDRIGIDRLRECIAFGFAEQACDHGRGVDDHHHIPFSS